MMIRIDVARAARLNRIRRGQVQPRPHCAQEMRAWREGMRARKAFWVAMGGVLLVVGVIQHHAKEIEPARKHGALAVLSER